MKGSATEEQIAAAMAYEKRHVPALFRQWAPRVLEAARVERGHSVLDVACGTGVLAREASVRVARTGSVVGVDPDPGMLTVAEQIAPHIEWRLGTAEQLPCESDAFDAVVLLEVARAQGDVVEQAETHAPVSFGMVARWPHQGKGVVEFPAVYHSYGV